MIVISGFTCPPTIHFKFITKCDGLFHYKVLWSVITKCDKCYYKVRQVLQIATIIITKYDRTEFRIKGCKASISPIPISPTAVG